MKKIIVILFTCILIACCPESSPVPSKLHFVGNPPLTDKKDMPTVCIEGVQYIIFREYTGNRGYGYMSVKFNSDGTVATCKK